MDSKQAPKTCKRQAGGREGKKPTARKRSARNRVNSRGKEKTIMTNEKDLMKVAQKNESALTFKSAFDTLLPVKAIETERDAVIIYKTALAIGDKSAYKACKALALVREKKLFKSAAKSFNEWAEKNGISKSAANARAKLGVWIDENGEKDIFADLRGHNFDYGTLVLLFEKTKGNADTVRDLINAGRLPLGVTADDVRKLFKLNPADEVKTDGATTAEKPADSESEQTTENPAESGGEKLYKVALQFTRADLQAVKEFFKQSEEYEEIISFPPALLAFATACAKLIKE